MTRDERRARNAAAKKAEKDARERRKSSQNPDISAPDDEFSNPAPDPTDVLNQSSTPDVNDPPTADPPAPNAPDATPEGDGGQDSAAAPIQRVAYPELGVMFEVPPVGDPNAQTGFVLQTAWSFTDNAQQFISSCGITGSVSDYIRGCIATGQIHPKVMYLRRDGMPVDDPQVPKEVAKVVLSSYYSQLEAVQPTPQATPVNHLFASVAPENFEAAYNGMSKTQRDSAVASIEQMMQVTWKNPFSSAPDPQPSPTEDPPTQP